MPTVFTRIFEMLYEENDDMFTQLLLYTEVKWLFRGHSLQRYVDLYSSTVQFMADVDPCLCEELNIPKKCLFCLADLYSKFGKTQKRLQGNVIII